MVLGGPSSSGASSSQAQVPDRQAEVQEKRVLETETGEDEMLNKTQNISSVCIGFGASDEIGESPCSRTCEQDLVDLVKEYEERHVQGQNFVHVRKKHSSNMELKALQELTKGEQIYTVKLESWKGGAPEIGEGAESIITNSKHVASVIERAACRSCSDVEKTTEKEIRGPDWKSNVLGFEQHMREEDEVRINWQEGSHETCNKSCNPCGDKHAWGRKHTCCDQQCKGVLNAPNAFPFAAWADISGAKRDLTKVVKARKEEIGHPENQYGGRYQGGWPSQRVRRSSKAVGLISAKVMTNTRTTEANW